MIFLFSDKKLTTFRGFERVNIGNVKNLTNTTCL